MFEQSRIDFSVVDHNLESVKNKSVEQLPLIKSKINEKDMRLTQLIIYIVGLTDGLTHLASLALYYLFKDFYRLTPYQVSLILMCPYIPYILKPLTALITDSVAICGLRRKPYLFIFSLLQALCFMVLAFVNLSIFQACVILFLLSLSGSFCTTVAEALVIEITKEGCQTNKANKITEFIGAKAVGSLSVAYFSGYLLEKVSKERIFVTTSLFPMLIFFATFYLRERVVVEKKSIMNQLRDLVDFINNPILLGPFLYIFIYMAGPDYDDAFFYFCTNKLGFRPAFMGLLRLTYGLASLIGIVCYRMFLKNASLKKTLIVTTLISFPIYVSPIMLTEQINTFFGISNEVFVLSGGFLIEAITELQLLPLFVLTASISQSGLEASIYATVYSIKNLGAISRKGTSSILIYLMNIDSYNFNNMSLLILICGFCLLLSLLVIPLLPSDEQIQELEAKK